MTLCVAWIRQVGDTEELVFATDSMFSGGGEVWKQGIKLFELPRKDCLLCFTGMTERAYTLILNLFSSINFDKDLSSDSFGLDDVVDYISDIFSLLVKTIQNQVSGKTEFFGIIWPSSDGTPYFQGRKYNLFNKPPVKYFDSDTFEILDMDIPSEISLCEQETFGEDFEFIQECYPNGKIKNGLTEYHRYRIKVILKEVAYSQFLATQQKAIKKAQEI